MKRLEAYYMTIENILDKIADVLIEKETIFGDEFMEIFMKSIQK